MGKAEGSVEGYLIKRCKEHGMLCLKFISGENGVPDRIVIYGGRVVFVETKAPTGRGPRPLQIEVHAKMRAHGAEVWVINTREKVDPFIAQLIATTTQTQLAPTG